jgi:hypothetical protein
MFEGYLLSWTTLWMFYPSGSNPSDVETTPFLQQNCDIPHKTER